MDDIGHSSLLKFLVKDTMSEKNIESKVPGDHNLREVSNDEINTEKETLFPEEKAQSSSSVNTDEQNQSLSEGNTSEIATAEDFTLSPVITVTKKEATFTKGDLKLQKVTVTEDISQTSINNDGEAEEFNRRLTYEIHSSSTQPKNKDVIDDSSKEREASDFKRLKTKIPMSRLRQVVNRVKNDIKEKKRLEKEKDTASSSRKSSIPRLKDSKIPQLKETRTIKKEESLVISQADKEFDRIFQELNPTEDISLEFINTEVENVNQIENCFEEIIHAYEEDRVTQTYNTEKVRQSRIPLLKRRSEHEIEVPNINRVALKKSNSIDTSKVQTSFKHEANSEQRKFITEQNKQSKITSERYVQREYQNVAKNRRVTDNNTVTENITAFNKDISYQQSNSNEIKETIKVAIPVFDNQLKRIESTDDTEDLNQDITISKNLNFDKETVSKIYKIDFTENNFDSMDTLDKSTLINENRKHEVTDVKNDNIEPTNLKEITNKDSQTFQVKTNINHTESSAETTKMIERIDNISTSVSREANRTEEYNNVTTEGCLLSDRTNENVPFSNQTTVKEITHAANKTVENKTSNVQSQSETVTYDNIKSSVKLVSLVGNMTTVNKSVTSSQSITSEENIKSTRELLDSSEKIEFHTNNERDISHDTNKITETTTNTLKTTIDKVNVGEIENKKQELLDNCTNVEFATIRQVSLETNKITSNKASGTIEQSVKINERNENIENMQTSIGQVSLEGDKSTKETANNLSEDALTQSVKINEENKNATHNHQIDKSGKVEYDSASKKVPLEIDTTNTKVDKTNVQSSIQSIKISERCKIEGQRHLVNIKENIDSSDVRTFDKQDKTLSEETLVKSKTNEKKSKLNELLRKYENIEFDDAASIKEILRETSIENKNSSRITETFESSIKTEVPINNEISTISETSDEIRKTKTLHYQASNKYSNEYENSISTETTEKTVTTKANKEFTEISSKYSNTNLNQLNINSNEMTTSKNSLNNEPISSLIIKDKTKSPTNIYIQNKEVEFNIYSDVFTKINATQNKQSDETNNEVKQTNKTFDINKNNIQNTMEEDIPILKGKVDRVIRRINSIDNTKALEKNTNDLPKKKSILSKIKMFERGEPDEIYPKTRISKMDTKSTRIPHPFRQTSTELRKPKIVREIFKETNEHKVVKGNTESIQFERQQESTEKIKDIDTKLINKSVKYSLNNNTLLANYKRVKDVAKEINTKNNENKTTEKTNQETTDTNLKLSTQNTFEKTNMYEAKQTEINKERKLNTSQYGSQSFANNGEIINKSESSKIYTKIYTNIDSGKTLTGNKYEIPNTKSEDQSNDTDKSEEVFNFTLIENDYKDIFNLDNSHVNTAKYINTEHSIVSDSESKGLEFITNTNNSQCTRKSLERLESNKDGRREFDIRRTTSVAELEIGEVIKGRVHEMIMRINSMEMLSQGKKELTATKEQPRKSSVSEKIALFEGKLPVKAEKRKELYKMKNETVRVENKEEDYNKKIVELMNAKNNYVNINTELLELRDGSMMPAIALGTALLEKPLIKHVVEAAIDMGYRAIDTAYIYGNEKEIGEAINNKISDGTVKREELYIISKLWSTYHRRDLVERACRQSLQNMGLQYFDLYLIHNPMSLLEGDDPLPKIANVIQYSEHDYMEAWCGIEDLVLKGLVKRGGISNFNSEQVHRVMEKGRMKPVVNQVECHPYLSQERLGGFCDAYGMRLSCYGVLGSKGTPAEHKSDLPPVIDDPLVQVMAAGLGVSPGQLLVAYQLHNGRSVVIKATSAAHLYDNLKAQFISLEPTHLTALKSLNKNKRTYYLKGLGETHKNYPFNIAF